jgi:ankyrin repeat protein
VRALLKHGAALNETDFSGGTAFMAAAVGGHFDLADELLARGASPRDGAQLALFAVSNTERLEYLTLHGVALDEASGYEGRTALMVAAENGHAESVQFLLDHGCNPRRRTTAGSTALNLVEAKIAAGAAGPYLRIREALLANTRGDK